MTFFNFVGKNSAELAALNESLQNLLDGIQVIYTLYSHEPLEFAVACVYMFSLSKKFPLVFGKRNTCNFVDIISEFRSCSLAKTCKPNVLL